MCLLPGTEIAFEENIQLAGGTFTSKELPHKTAVFAQYDKDQLRVHHDYLEFADGSKVLLHALAEGQKATVLQLPAQPKTKEEAEFQRRAEYV